MSSQALAAARTPAEVQEDAARKLVAGRTTETLLQIVRDIAKMVVPGDGKPAHAFPQLAGSHLSEVRQRHTSLDSTGGVQTFLSS